MTKSNVSGEIPIIPPADLIYGYSNAMFPMAPDKDSDVVEWFTATRRGIIPLERFHISRNVERIIRQHKFEVAYDRNFRGVIEACANRKSTWISPVIIESYNRLHSLGFAHSVEIYIKEKMVGGLYGVALNAAFFGESMFHYETDMDKVALYYCHKRLVDGGFELWDTQFYTDHLSRFGCEEISAGQYHILLQKAMQKDARF